jgi:hypothetical protein
MIDLFLSIGMIVGALGVAALPPSPAWALPGAAAADAHPQLVQTVGHRRHYRDHGTYVWAPFTEVDTRRGTYVRAPFARVYSGREGTYVRAPFVNLFVPR